MKKLIQFNQLIVGGLVLALFSCRTGKNYQRPSVLLPEQFNQVGMASGTDTNSIADISWRNYFSDPALRQLIDSGISRNYDLQYALKNIVIAQSQVKQANWLWIPQVNARLSGYFYRNSDNGPSGINNGAIANNSTDWLASVNMSWEIDIWGKISRQQEGA